MSRYSLGYLLSERAKRQKKLADVSGTISHDDDPQHESSGVNNNTSLPVPSGPLIVSHEETTQDHNTTHSQ